MELIGAWFEALWELLVESGVWLLLGFVVGGAIHVLVPSRLLQAALGKPGIGSVVRASAIGAPLPLCSCAVIPTASALRKSGASKGSAAAFAISTPEIEAPSVAMTWALMGPAMAVSRVTAAVSTAIAAGLAIDASGRRGREQAKSPTALEPVAVEPARGCGDGCGCGPEPSERADAGSAEDRTDEGEPGASKRAAGIGTAALRLGESLRQGLVVLPRDLSLWIVAGLAISAFIMVLVPEGWIGEHLGDGMVAKLVMLAAGIPWYVCATASTPIAAALVAQGLSPGAAIVFLLSGPATNPATMAWVLRDLGGRALLIYLLVIGSVSLGAGVLVDAALPAGWFHGTETEEGVHGHGLLMTLGGAMLAIVLGWGMVGAVWARVERRRQRTKG